MNSKTTIKKLTLGSLALAAVAGAGLAFTPNSAHADTSSPSGVGILKSVDGGKAGADAGATGGIFTLTFNGQTTSPLLGERVTFTTTVQPADGKGAGNVEFEWKVEEGESAPIDLGNLADAGEQQSATGDGINIGVGELQECTISKSMDMANTTLTQFAINGNAPAADDRLGNFEIQHLMSDLNNSDGAKGGNVEFEWKVEEGES